MKHTKFAQSGNKTLSRPVPNLSVGDHHTKLSALHRIKFTGPLLLWEDFEDEVVNEIKNLRPKLEGIINHENLSKVSPYYMNQEHVQVGDEHGVQGRFQQNIGQAVSAVLKAAGFSVTFSDYKASSAADLSVIPDVVVIEATSSDLRAAGEIKVPWVQAHNLRAIFANELKLKKALGQIAKYMLSFSLKYGFLSTYNETIFLKQDVSARHMATILQSYHRPWSKRRCWK